MVRKDGGTFRCHHPIHDLRLWQAPVALLAAGPAGPVVPAMVPCGTSVVEVPWEVWTPTVLPWIDGD